MKPARRQRQQTSRLAPEVRRRQIMDAAAGLLTEQGHLPLPLDALAARAGVSKPLIYAYFPTQFDLLNALLRREMESLLDSGLDAASKAGSLEAAVLDCALIYFERVAGCGPTAHLIVRDPFMADRLERAVLRARDRVIRRLARRARRELELNAKEAIAAIGMATTIPEEAGQLAFRGEMTAAAARDLCRRLVASSLDALRPPRT